MAPMAHRSCCLNAGYAEDSSIGRWLHGVSATKMHSLCSTVMSINH